MIARLFCALIGHRWRDVTVDAARQAGLVFLHCRRCGRRDAAVREWRV